MSGIYGDEMPMVHCHCFTRELDPALAEKDIRQVCSGLLDAEFRNDHGTNFFIQRVEEKLGHALTPEVSLHLVRSVAPNKEMYCISFRLPKEVAYAVEQ